MVAVGAAIAIGGTFLDTYKVTVGIQSLESVNLTSTYFDADRGKVVAGIGAAVLVLALIGLLRVGDHLIPAVVAGLGGAVILGLSIYDRIDLDDFLDDQAPPAPDAGLAHLVPRQLRARVVRVHGRRCDRPDRRGHGRPAANERRSGPA